MATDRSAREILAAIKAWREWTGNPMLDQLGVPKIEGAMNRDARFIQRMCTASADAEHALQEFFEIGRFAQPNDIWQERRFRLFISHSADAKTFFEPLATALSHYGIHCFLAHEAIQPAANWRDVLLKALGSMDALLAFHTNGFRQSEWCAQEVGFALGKGTNVIAVMAGEVPAGFLGARQGIKWNPEKPQMAVQSIINCLHEENATALALGNALARELKFAGTFDASDFYVAALEECGELTAAAKRSIELALLLNNQVRGREGAMALVGQDEEAGV